jgi:hypothetical protein
MARLLVKNPDPALAQLSPEILLTPGRNRLGREGENDFLVPHPSVSRQHCEVWLTEDAVLVRDLNSRNGTFVENARVQEAEILTGQTLRLGDVEMIVAEAPVRISVPPLHLAGAAPEPVYMPDGSPCCFHHPGVEAKLRCTKCEHVFCMDCVRELRVSGGTLRRYCTECGGPCERLAPTVKETKRGGWFDKIVGVLMKPPPRR